MKDHSQCTDEIRGDDWFHSCPPCPHGLTREGSVKLTGDARIDAMQRELKMQTIDGLTCDDRFHAEALGCAPMSLSAEAKRLLERQPVDKTGMCIYCERVPQKAGHAMDCAWRLPHWRILSVLRLIDRVSELSVWSGELEDI